MPANPIASRFHFSLARACVFLFLLGLEIMLPFAVYGQKPPTVPAGAVAVVLATNGVVEFSTAKSQVWQRAPIGQALRIGDSIRTLNGRATLLRSNQKVMQLGVNSTASFAAPDQLGGRPILDLLKGMLHLFSREQPADDQFRTPQASGATLGTEFVLSVEEPGTTTLAVLEGKVELTNQLGRLELRSGEQGEVQQGKAPTNSPALNAVNFIQWILYYPAVIDPAELGLTEAENQSLAPSIEAYRAGDLVGAAANLPEERLPGSAAERVYRAALLLSLGQVAGSETLLNGVTQDAATGVQPRLAAALRQLIAAVKFQSWEPTNSPALASEWLAESYYRQSRSNEEKSLERALDAAHAATKLSPEFGFAWVRVAELEFSFGRTREALAALERGTQLSPRNAQAFALRGFLLSAENRITQAIEQFDRAIELDSALGNAWLGRGLCRIRQGHSEEGQQDLLVAATREPHRAVFRSYLGKAYGNAGDLPRAVKELELARGLDENDPTAWLYSALLNQQGNRVNAAVRDLERSQELNDNRSLFRSRLLLDQDRAVGSANLAAIYRDAGMMDVSVREAYRAVNTDYANYSAHLFLANSYDALRDPKQINLRYETPWLSEYLIANLLAPVGAGTLSPTISQQEYSRLLERDRFGVVSSTEYLSSGEWIQSGAQFGVFGNLSYSIDAAYRNDNGQRPNNDLEHLTLSFQFKQQFTPQDSLYFQAIYYDYESGDVFQYYDQATASRTLRVKENQEPILIAGWHHNWNPENQTLLLVSRLDDRLHVLSAGQGALLLDKDAAGNVNTVVPGRMNLDYQSDLEIYSAELQHIWQRAGQSIIGGIRYQTGEFDTRGRQTDPSAFRVQLPVGPINLSGVFAQPAADVFYSPGLERITLYAYHHWRILDRLDLIAGLSYDHLAYPGNHRNAPISSREENASQVSPKAGLIWTPLTNTTLRAGYAQSLGGVSFDQSFQLEPTQVAGFNQAFRSLIPDTVVGANAAPAFESWGVALDQKFPTGTYLGIAGEWYRSDVNRAIGVFDLIEFQIPPVPSETRQQLEFEERNVTLTVNQLLGDDWSLAARYRLSLAQLDSRFTDIRASVSPAAVLQQESTLHQLNLSAHYQIPCGFFGSVHGVWTMQSNRGYSPDQPGDDLWQGHVFAGYRFPRRRAEVRLGILNVSDQDYRLNPLTLYADLPRERTFTASVKFNF